MATFKSTGDSFLVELKPRKLFDPASVRKLELPNGLGAVLARRQRSEYWEVQGVRFAKTSWTEAAAKEFVSRTFQVDDATIQKLAKKQILPAQMLGVTEEEQKILAIVGLDAITKKNYKRARKVFQGLIALNPTSNLGHLGLGRTLQAEKQFDAALNAYKEALRWNPSDIDSLMGTAEIHLARGQKKPALPNLLQILHVDGEMRTDTAQKAKQILDTQYTNDELKDYISFGISKVQQMAKEPQKTVAAGPARPAAAPIGARPLAMPAAATGTAAAGRPAPRPLNLGGGPKRA